MKPTAALAYEGKGEFKAGDHCQFCKVKATCKKRAETNLELAKYDFEMPATLDDFEIAAILPRIDQLTSWECKIVCVKSNCADLFYAPYWGKQLKGLMLYHNC